MCCIAPVTIRAIAFVMPLLGLALAGGSMSSCGASGDHFVVKTMLITPDPPVRGKGITIILAGTLDQDVVSGKAEVDLDVKALHIVDKHVNASIPFSLSPTPLAEGDVRVTVGPFTLPRSIPGDIVASGQVRITTASGEPVVCIALDLNVPAIASDEAEGPQEEPSNCDMEAYGFCCEVGTPCDCNKGVVAPGQCEQASYAFCCGVGTPCTCMQPPIDFLHRITAEPAALTTPTVCNGQSDHLENVKFSTSSTGRTEVTGTLNEDIMKGTVAVDVVIHLGIFPIPFKITIPISVEPGLPKGALDWKFGQRSSDLQVGSPKVTGKIKMNDSNGEEVICLKLPSSGAAGAEINSKQVAGFVV